MKFLMTIVLAASYLTLGPVLAVETARSVQSVLKVPRPMAPAHNINWSVHYKDSELAWRG